MHITLERLKYTGIEKTASWVWEFFWVICWQDSLLPEGHEVRKMFILREKEVNVGRQRELDLVKGFLMIMIIFIHSFQTIGNMKAVTSNAHMVLFTLFMPTGACL